MPTIRNRSRRSKTPPAVFRPREVAAAGLSRTALPRLVATGEIVRIGRGLYLPKAAKVTEHHMLVEAVKRVPRAVVCMLSALRFHEMTTQNPHEVWVAIDVKARKPVADWPPLRVVRFSRRLLTAGVEMHVLEGAQVSIIPRGHRCRQLSIPEQGRSGRRS